jgi:hypothetical protein
MHVIRKFVQPHYPGLKPLIQVHDELIYACPKRFSKEVAVLIKYVMEYGWFDLDIPLLADTKICSSWADKDDDAVPQVGNYYAQVNGEHRLFTADNWNEYLELEKSGVVERKAACAQLTKADVKWAKTIVPDKGPMFRDVTQGRVLSREEELRQRQTI